MRLLLTSMMVLACAYRAHGEIQTRAIAYNDGETALEGYLAYDAAIEGKLPGVLIVHAWKGITDFEKQRAEAIAKLGYVAFALDIYGKEVRPEETSEARKLAGMYKGDRPLLRRRAQAGLDALKSQPNVDPTKVAAIGFCFGGTTALELARSGADLAGVVSFHGALDTPMPAEPDKTRAKVLVLHGADDPGVPPKQVTEFEEEMRNARADWQLVAFGNTVHSFTNPAAGNDNSKGSAYNEKADKRSWEIMKMFFEEVFK